MLPICLAKFGIVKPLQRPVDPQLVVGLHLTKYSRSIGCRLVVNLFVVNPTKKYQIIVTVHQVGRGFAITRTSRRPSSNMSFIADDGLGIGRRTLSYKRLPAQRASIA
ncbi:hypothetical protein GCM10023222_48680 [Saccharopolyspora cebuensis]